MPHHFRLFSSLVIVVTLPGLAISPSLAQGRSINSFPETTRQRAETSFCFAHTADGRSFDLTKLCVRPKPKNGTRNSGASANLLPNAPIGSGTAAGDRPSGEDSSAPQCYIFDTDGNPCR